MSTRTVTDAERVLQNGSSLAAVARRALRAASFERRSARCQKWVRQCVQFLHGSRFDQYHKATAELSRLAWSKSPYAVDPSHGSVVGDILYKRGTPSQPEGHVGIRVAGNRVAENSSFHWDGHDARGTRSLAQFGKVDLIVRLPEPR